MTRLVESQKADLRTLKNKLENPQRRLVQQSTIQIVKELKSLVPVLHNLKLERYGIKFSDEAEKLSPSSAIRQTNSRHLVKNKGVEHPSEGGSQARVYEPPGHGNHQRRDVSQQWGNDAHQMSREAEESHQEALGLEAHWDGIREAEESRQKAEEAYWDSIRERDEAETEWGARREAEDDHWPEEYVLFHRASTILTPLNACLISLLELPLSMPLSLLQDRCLSLPLPLPLRLT